jgi:ABC-type bacteriocin/lantibiotic exporter with double-glycine peptidase domain
MLAYPITSVILPKYYGKFVEDLKSNKTPNFRVTIFLLVLTNLMYMVLNKIDTIFIPKLQAYIRTNVVKVVLENYKDKYQEQELGSLISKIIKLPIVVRDLVRQFRNYIIPLCLVLIMVVVQFMMIDARLGLITLVGIVAIILILIPLGKKCLNVSSVMDGETDVVHENISELFDNLLDIYSMNTYKDEIQKLEDTQKFVIDIYQDTYNCTNKFRITMNSLGIILFLSIIFYAYKLYKKNVIDISKMININITCMYVIGRLGSISGEAPDIVFNLGTYHRIQSYLSNLDLQPTKIESFKINNGEIKFRDVGIKYGDKDVLKHFNLVIMPGESVAIIGKIGSGKSSLAKALLKLIQYEGHIYVDGKDISDLDSSTIRSQILFVRQNPLPFNRSLYENIVYGNGGYTRAHISDLFKKYDLNSFFDHKLEDSVGKKGSKLSGGQRQMIFLLRILLSKNPIIILDEPTSSLDDRSSKYVMKLLSDIVKERTVILITHDKKLGDMADRKIELT